jgi:phosphohistidine phosphatase
MHEGHHLYVVRHAIAAERGEAYPDDSKRPLTPKGAAKFRKAARGLAALDLAIDCILTSPFTRARETADVLAAELSARPPIVETATLVPGAEFQALVAELGKYRRYASIALVGHEPGIGETAARLIGLRHAIEFRKGAVCRIDVETLPPSGPGQLRWFCTQKILGSIGR